MENTCDEFTYNQLFKSHSEDLYNFIYYKFGTDFHPEDLVQDAFIQLWKNCKNVPVEKVRSYLFTVANNAALNLASKNKTRMNHARLNPTKERSIETPEYIMEGAEYMDRLQKALESLTEEQRVAFMLNKIEGKKHREIAEMLGISNKAVEKRIYKAIAHLKKQIGEI